jgi:hypothetical protein
MLDLCFGSYRKVMNDAHMRLPQQVMGGLDVDPDRRAEIKKDKGTCQYTSLFSVLFFGTKVTFILFVGNEEFKGGNIPQAVVA